MSLGYPLPPSVSSCFPLWFDYGDDARTIYDCVTSAGLACSYASDCATATYTVGQEPATTTNAVAVPTNPVVQNAGFETGTKDDGWSWDHGLTPFNTEDVSNVRTHSGSFAFRAIYLNDNGHNTEMKQDVQVTPGGNYTLSVWVSHDNPTGSWCGMFAGATPIVGWVDGEMTFRDVPASVWQKISVDFQAMATWTTISLNFYCNVGGTINSAGGKNTLYFDDVTVTSRDL
jgi:hypothetical protein